MFIMIIFVLKKLLKKLHFVKFDESYYYDDEGYVKKI